MVHGRVTLSSGQEADYYIDLRRITLHRRRRRSSAACCCELTADWNYDAAGGLTLGADPVGTAILHASDGTVDAFVVRKAEKQHGMQQPDRGTVRRRPAGARRRGRLDHRRPARSPRSRPRGRPARRSSASR